MARFKWSLIFLLCIFSSSFAELNPEFRIISINNNNGSGQKFCDDPIIKQAKTCIPMINDSKKEILTLNIKDVSIQNVNPSEARVLYSLKTTIEHWNFIVTKDKTKKKKTIFDGEAYNKVGIKCNAEHCRPWK